MIEYCLISLGRRYAYIPTFIIVHTHIYPRTCPYLYAYSPPWLDSLEQKLALSDYAGPNSIGYKPLKAKYLHYSGQVDWVVLCSCVGTAATQITSQFNDGMILYGMVMKILCVVAPPSSHCQITNSRNIREKIEVLIVEKTETTGHCLVYFSSVLSMPLFKNLAEPPPGVQKKKFGDSE